jgi:hypothetical protein
MAKPCSAYAIDVFNPGGVARKADSTPLASWPVPDCDLELTAEDAGTAS